MGTAFSWGFPEEQALQQNAGSVDPDVIVRDALRSSATTAFLTPQSASPTAQNSAGLGVQNIKRGFLDLRVPYDSTVVGVDFQTTSTSFVDVGDELTGQMVSSGRPVLVIIRAFASDSRITARIDSLEVTGGTYGITPGSVGYGIWVANPTAGSHTYAMQWRLTSGTALMTRESRPALTVVEL